MWNADPFCFVRSISSSETRCLQSKNAILKIHTHIVDIQMEQRKETKM